MVERATKAAARQVDSLYNSTVQDIDHALGATVQAVGIKIVTATLRGPCIDQLYRPRVVAAGKGSLSNALQQAEVLLNAFAELYMASSPLLNSRPSNLIPLMAASIGRAQLSAWDEVVFHRELKVTADQQQILLKDLAQLRDFLYDSAKRTAEMAHLNMTKAEAEADGEFLVAAPFVSLVLPLMA
jgi:hypothetical protein